MTNILDFGASTVKSLAWPAVVVIAMAMFRMPLTTLLGRVRRVAVSEGTAVIDFRAALANVEARLPAGAPLARSRVAGLLQSPAAPTETIDAAWTRLQAALGRGDAPLPADLVALIGSLHALRNQAVERRVVGLTGADALRFEDAAERVGAQIDAG